MNTQETHIDEIPFEFFHELAEVLYNYGVRVQTTWASPGHPILRPYASQQGEGVYFRREEFGNWTPSEVRTLKSILPFSLKGYAVTLADISDMASDLDNDRTWPASFAVVPIDPAVAEFERYERDGEVSQSTYYGLAGR